MLEKVAKLDEAIRNHEIALKINTNYKFALFSLGRLYKNSGKKAESI
jgi:tetratricopeptide (TPR) repeat protein